MGAQEYQPPAELLSVAEIEERRPLVHKIEQTIRRHNDEFKMQQKHLGPAFFLPRPVLDAYIDNKPRELQELLESFTAADPRALEQMMSLMGYELDPKLGFGSRGNMFALNRTLAKWRRMGLWTFESIQEPQKADKGWENALKFYWLPDCSKKLEPGENAESVDATIDRVIQCLSVAQSNGLPPRTPVIGTGRYRYWLDAEQMLRSGLVFRVQHETKEEAVVFRNIINRHWVYSRVSMISC